MLFQKKMLSEQQFHNITLEKHTLGDQLFVGIEYNDVKQMPQVFGATLQTLATLFASHPEMKIWSQKSPTTLCNRTSGSLVYRIGYILSLSEASVLLEHSTAEPILKQFATQQVFLHSIPSGHFVKYVHRGSLDQLPQAWEAVLSAAKEQHLVLDINPWTYWQTCNMVPNSNEWIAEIWYRTLSMK